MLKLKCPKANTLFEIVVNAHFVAIFVVVVGPVLLIVVPHIVAIALSGCAIWPLGLIRKSNTFYNLMQYAYVT